MALLFINASVLDGEDRSWLTMSGAHAVDRNQ